MLRTLVATALLTGCWTSSRPAHLAHPAEPPRWQAAATAELFPEGAWFAAAVDYDVDSPQQRAAAKQALTDPAAATNDHGCHIPALHAGVASYHADDFAFAVRGPMREDAMAECLAHMFGAQAKRSVVDGRELLVLTNAGGTTHWLVSGGEHGMILGGPPDVMTRMTARDLKPASADSRIGPLITRARAGGQLWGAMLVPQGSPAVHDVLAVLGVTPKGKIISAIGSAHLTQPYRIDITIELERADDAKDLAAALDAARQVVSKRVGTGLQPLLDAIVVHAEGTRITLTALPAQVDWMQAVGDVLTFAAQLRGE
jgi:hypothetical protein